MPTENPTKEEIVNKALGLLNGNYITTFDDTSIEAGLADGQYNTLRDAVLEEADWTFATESTTLVADVDQPPIPANWSTKFTIPSHYLRVMTFNGNKPGKEWVKEKNFIYTNYAAGELRGIIRVTDTFFYSRMFIEAFVMRLAWTWCMALTQNKKLHEEYKDDYIFKIETAANTEGQQGTPENTGKGRLNEARLRDGGHNTMGPTV